MELKAHVKHMAELNQLLSKQAESIIQAMSRQVKQQGDREEEILETILQHVGLQKGLHYFAQYQPKNDERQTIRSDLVNGYPDNSFVVSNP